MRVATAVGLTLVPLAVLLIALWLGQRRLIYFPTDQSVRSVSQLTPGGHDVSFTTEDGLVLDGWYLTTEGSRRTVLFFNGNAGSRDFRLPLAEELRARGYAVLLFDYRGYGGNPGSPTEEGLIRDARAAQAWLVARPDVDPEGLVYVGESLGAALALALAAERPPSALVLRSPFTSMVDVGRVHYPWLPIGLLLQDRYASIERIRRVECPLLVIAGEGDSIVPHAQSRRLFEAAPGSVKQFVSIPGADHNDPRLTQGTNMVEEIARFLLELEGRR